MSKSRIACLPGDGIGPEVVHAARQVLDAAGLEASWSTHAVGWDCWTSIGNALPEQTLRACASSDAMFFGAITSKPDAEAQAALPPGLRGRSLYRSPILRLRQELDLYANIRPVKGPGVDLVVVRENTEGLYAGHEVHPTPPGLAAFFPGLPTGPDVAISLRVVTRQASERICETAFRIAKDEGRTNVTLVEKPNVLRRTGGVMRAAFSKVATAYPGIAAHEENVDAACARLVKDAGAYEVIVATNLFGDILSDVAAEAGGGLPLAASANLGPRHALFEPVHGSAPGIAGKGIANPLGAIRSGALMARHLGQARVAESIDQAVASYMEGPAQKPQDMGGRATTQDVVTAILGGLPSRR